LTELTPPSEMARPLARAILSWAKKNECDCIISTEGIDVKKGNDVEDTESDGSEFSPIWGIGSTDRSRAALEEKGIEQLEEGMITGVTAVLLNEGRWQDFNVISLLAEARSGYPDARAAASLINAINKMVDTIDVDTSKLLEEAKKIESRIEGLRDQAKPIVQKLAPTYMYG